MVLRQAPSPGLHGGDYFAAIRILDDLLVFQFQFPRCLTLAKGDAAGVSAGVGITCELDLYQRVDIVRLFLPGQRFFSGGQQLQFDILCCFIQIITRHHVPKGDIAIDCDRHKCPPFCAILIVKY